MRKFIKNIEMYFLIWLCAKYDLHTRKSVKQHQFATACAANAQIRAYIKMRRENRFNPQEVEGPILLGLLDALRKVDTYPHLVDHVGPSSIAKYDYPPKVTSFPHEKLGNW